MAREDVVEIQPRHFRDVLGQVPTAVVAITSRSVADGSPIGMTLGTFTSVSLDPPLVAFLPDRTSSTYPQIREAGRFCANILAGNQKTVSQTFATKGADRFAGVEWRESTHTGSPILAGSLAWVDCEIVAIHEAGDHDIVVGRVLELDVERSGLPLVYFQAGYGTFTLRSLLLATRGELNDAARLADSFRPELEKVSADFGVECRVFAREGDELVVVMTTGYTGPSDRVGLVVPFCPPFGVSFAAWGDAAVRERWYENAPGVLTPAQRVDLEAELDRIRASGWTVAYANGPFNEVGTILEDIAEIGQTPVLERRLLAAGRELVNDFVATPKLDAGNAATVRSVTVPVLRDGVVKLHLVARGFPPDTNVALIENVRAQLIALAATPSLVGDPAP